MSESFLFNLDEINNKGNPQKKKKFFLRIPFIFIFLIIIFLFAIGLLIYYIYFYIENKPNFRIVDLPWIKADLNDREYEDYLFDNGLEVLMIHDEGFDMDGGAIVIEDGHLDNPYAQGISSFATSLLSHIAFEDINHIPNLEDYFGSFIHESEDYFVNFRFDILNAGFTKFLSDFGKILNIDYDKISDNCQSYKSKIISELDKKYLNKINDIMNRENHLLEYLVYGFCDSNNNDILPEGNNLSLSLYNDIELLNNATEYIQNLINPEKIKIVLFSKYKFIISSKYMKNYFHYLTHKQNIANKRYEEKYKYEIKELNKSQIIYIKANDHESNYIKIIYYIDKIKNESYSELIYKSNYLLYIIDFLKETKNGSLYSLLTNSTDYNIKSINAYSEIILKSKIKFTIFIELNCLKNINDIIFITYQYIHKIIKEAIGHNLQMNRYIDLKDLCFQHIKFKEKTYDTMELAKNNGKNLIFTKYKPEYYYYIECLLLNSTEVFEETQKYLSQLTPNNSVIILGLKDDDRKIITCNEDCPFKLNCSFFTDDNNIKNTTYYDVYYKNYFFDYYDFEKYLDINPNSDIEYINNSYISKHNKSLLDIKEELKDIERLDNKTVTLNNFYFKRNANFHVPKVYISLNLFHPYLRPNNTETNKKKCNYFKILEIFSAIRRKINDKLADAIRADNNITFGQNENYLFINILCFEDVAYKILETIKNIIIDTNWASTDFITNNIIYKNEVFQDFLIFDKSNIEEISKYYFYCKLKNSLYNKYEFFPKDFEQEYYEICVSDLENKLEDLTTFIINGYIYGYYTEDQATKIYELFEIQDISLKFNEIIKNANINDINSENYVNWVNEISELKNNYNQVYINSGVYNKTYFDNYGIRYMSFDEYISHDESLINITIFESVFSKAKIDYETSLVNYHMIYYRDIYFELIFYDNNKSSTIPNNATVKTEWENRIGNCSSFNDPVDNIGNRYYYFKKNFVLSLIKKQTSLEQRAVDELMGFKSNGKVFDPEKLMKDYNDKYKDKKFDEKELNETLKYYNESIAKENKKVLDIFIVE
jgi:hypothetical protein